jgi:hypothetical protein
MYVAELETRPFGMQADRSTEEAQTDPMGLASQMNEQASAADPMDTLVEELREEFKRGLVRQAVQKETMRRNRRVALTCLVAPGLLIAAAMCGKVMHSRIEAARHETRYGR